MSTWASYFSLVHEKSNKNNKTKSQLYKGAQDRGSVLPVLRCQMITINAGINHTLPLSDMESSSLFLSLRLFISVSRHLRAQRQCKSDYQRDYCSLGLALGEYSTATKRWLSNWLSTEAGQAVFFPLRSLPVSELYQMVSWWLYPLRGEVPMFFFLFLCNKYPFWGYMSVRVAPFSSSPLMNLKKTIDITPKNHIWQTKTIREHRYLFSLFGEGLNCNLAKHSRIYCT